MLTVIEVVLNTPQDVWYQKDGFWIFNTEYGYIITKYRHNLFGRIKAEWPEGFNPIDFNNELLIMAALDNLIEADLPHMNLGVMYRVCKEMGMYARLSS